MKTIFIFCLLIITISIHAQNGGKVLWKFKANDSYIQGRPAVGADGTIYALGIQGHLYALTPQGKLKWTYTATYGSVQSVSVGNDGTIYFGGLNTVYAINPNGSLKWSITNPAGGLIVAGPNVGPDGNIYAVAENQTNSGLGAISITPSGILRWNKLGYVVPRTAAGQTREIVFSAGQLYFNLNRVDAISGLQALKMSNGDRVWTGAGGTRQPAVAPDGRIYTISAELTNSYAEISSFTTSGNLIKKFFGNNTKDLTSPDVGSDGIFYVGRNYQNLVAENPNGTQKFSVTAKAYIQAPIVNSTNTLVAFGGSQSFAPGYVKAVTTAGVVKWTRLLSLGGDNYATPLSRPRFSNDNTAVYIGTALNNSTSICYLYAIATGEQAVEKSNIISEIRVDKNESNIKAFPNPAKDYLIIEPSSFKGKVLLQVYDVNGKMILNENSENINPIKLDVSALKQGVFVLKITGESGNSQSINFLKE